MNNGIKKMDYLVYTWEVVTEGTAETKTANKNNRKLSWHIHIYKMPVEKPITNKYIVFDYDSMTRK